MSIEFFWRRIDGKPLNELSPTALVELVPLWHRHEPNPLYETGMAMLVGRNGYLMHVALTSVDTDPGDVAQLPVFGGEKRIEGENDPEYGFVGTELWVLTPEQVQTAASFLNSVAVTEVMTGLDGVLGEEVMDLGFSTPWSEKWAAELMADLERLKGFFAAAAAAGDAMIKYESA